MSQIDFRRLFGILFTIFIIIWTLFFLIVIIADKQSMVAAIILITLPLLIRYIVYKLTNI
jgi:hypothetical protein